MRKIVVTLVALAVIMSGMAPPLRAQDSDERPLNLIRDSEIEDIIRHLAEPIFQVAGVSPGAVTIYLVNDPGLNAFVSGGQNLFIHTGLILQVHDAGELVGVMAHETGHIAGGHVIRGQAALESAQRTAILTTLLGVAAALAAGNGGAGVAMAGGGASLAERNFLSFTRSMENSADQAALTFMDRAGISAAPMLAFLERLENQELVPASRQDAYIRTHPLTRDRVDAVRAHVARSPATSRTLPASALEEFRRMQAKLLAFLQPQTALRRYANDDSIAGRYARAIALYRRNDVTSSLALMTGLLAQEPNNPFFHELVGQINLEHGRIPEARQAYLRAVQLRPHDPLILVALAQARLATNSPADLQAAITDLNRAVTADEGGTPMAWRLLATAYGRSGDLGMAAMSLAEEALGQGDYDAARQHAERALRTLRQGSPGWLRAQDVQRAAENEHDRGH